MIRFGIAGFGLHAVHRLMPGFASAKNCQVTALSRQTLAAAQESARQYGIPLAFDSVEALCSSPEVDAVFVTTPDAFHLKDVLTAIEHGKPVLCEKPLAMNAEECREMVEAARQAKVLLGVAHVFRFERSTTRLRERLAAGEIGHPTFARSEFSYPAQSHPRKWLTDPTLAAGGPIADVGVHCIDTLRYILQDEVVRVTAHTKADKASGKVEASAVLSLEFARGALGAVLVSTRAEYRTPIELVGDAGVLRANNALNVERPIAIELLRGGAVVDSETVSNQDAYSRQVDAFAVAIEGKGAFPAPGEEGWTNQKILDACYRSAATGKQEAL
jgi:predicted dehydrogenase